MGSLNPPTNGHHDQNQVMGLDEQYAQTILKTMNEYRKQSQLCDVFLKVGNSRIGANRQVLSVCSPYFHVMFLSQFAESQKLDVEMYDLDVGAMEEVVDFCYTSQIKLDGKNVQNILHAACLLQMQSLMDKCAMVLKKQINLKNVRSIRSLAEAYNFEELSIQTKNFMSHHFEELTASEEFLCMPLQELVELLSSDDLNVISEEVVYEGVRNWVREDTSRQADFPQILAHVRLSLCSPLFLLHTVQHDPLVKTDIRCRDLLDEAKDHHLISGLAESTQLLLKQEASSDTERAEEVRKRPRGQPECIYAVGGYYKGEKWTARVEMFDPKTSQWSTMQSMGSPRDDVGVTVLGEHLYVVGGTSDGTNPLSTVARFNPATGWSDVAPMHQSRYCLGAATLQGHIYAIGGYDGSASLASVERYDPQTNTWSNVANMNLKRWGVGVAVMDGYLYAVGGKDGNNSHSAVERYDPRSNTWERLTSMDTERHFLGCTAYDGQLYAVGGKNRSGTVLASIEKYNPIAGKWTRGPDMNTRRQWHGVCVAKGKIYVIGGNEGNTIVNSVEVYDRKSETWSFSKKMNVFGCGFGVGVLNFQEGYCPCIEN